MLPLAEHPADCSWGYQDTGFYAPTARYGAPDGLKKLIDSCHQNDIGVILDFVPIHFAMDAYGLRRLTERHFMNMITRMSVKASGGHATLIIPAERLQASYSPMPITGYRSFI